MEENIILDVRHLQKGYGKIPVLKDINFRMKEGYILGLIGKNGAGKTTLMKSILGLNRNFRGELLFQGKQLFPSDEKMKAEIGSLVDVSFYEDMSAYQNLKAAMMLTRVLPFGEQDRRIGELLAFVGLEHVDKKVCVPFPSGCSSGWLWPRP